MKKTMPKLSKSELDKLAVTKDDDLLTEFPGFKRSVLRSLKAQLPTIPETIGSDRELIKAKSSALNVGKKYNQLLSDYEKLEAERDALLQIKGASVESINIKPNKEGKSEATPVICWSDWHIEEEVLKGNINGLNEYNLEIADFRIQNLFKNTLSLVNLCSRDVNITDLIVWLGGDFINGSIHEELVEGNLLSNMAASILAQKYIKSGIDFLLKHTKTNIKVVCNSGNHARTTKQQRIATESGNSLEYFIYNNLATIYEKEPRVMFLIPSGYHAYVNVYGYILRFHHGHQMKYGGGVGGLYIPANKSIAQWNKGLHAVVKELFGDVHIKGTLDIFGHFHQMRDGGSFICNGSVVGYNDYALSIKADYEEPKQAFFLIDKKRGKTITTPILVNQN